MLFGVWFVSLGIVFCIRREDYVEREDEYVEREDERIGGMS